jgi:hypothetical protein
MIVITHDIVCLTRLHVIMNRTTNECGNSIFSSFFFGWLLLLCVIMQWNSLLSNEVNFSEGGMRIKFWCNLPFGKLFGLFFSLIIFELTQNLIPIEHVTQFNDQKSSKKI